MAFKGAQICALSVALLCSFATARAQEVADTLDAARVSADRMRTIFRTQTGLTRLDRSNIKRGFAVFSTPDLIKTLQLQPGVASGTELMSGLFVHGGTGGDNLFLLDGSSIYNTSHLIGLFSAFNVDVVKQVDFYKSGFPAQYGGRLSSVVDVSTRDGNLNEHHGTFSLGLIEGRLMLEGPVVRGRTSYQFGLRRTWMESITVPFQALLNSSSRSGTHSQINYAFWDLNFGLTHHISDKDVLRLRFFNGMDRLDGESKQRSFSDAGVSGDDTLVGAINWGSTTAGLIWNHNGNGTLDYRAGLYYSYNKTSLKYSSSLWSLEDGIESHFQTRESDRSGVHGIRLGTDFDWVPSEMHHVRFGASWEHHFYLPARSFKQWNERGTETDIYSDIDVAHRCTGEEPSLYIEDELKLLPGFAANAGMRAALFIVNGKTYFLPEPRLSLRFDVNDEVSVKASYSLMNQFEHRLQTTYIDLPSYIWIPTSGAIRPIHSQQYAGGVHILMPHGMHLDIEGFWKTMEHLYEYDGPAVIFPPLDNWETILTEGKGRAYGTEVTFGWMDGDRTVVDVAYTLSWSERFFPEFSERWFPDRNDNRHKLNITATHKFSKRFEIYGAWVYHSGNRMTVGMQGKYIGSGIEQGKGVLHYYDPVYTGPNNIKMPDYHRLDAGMNFIKVRADGKIRTWNLSIYNVYCRINTVYASVDIVDGEYKGVSYGFIPIIPTFSYTLDF